MQNVSILIFQLFVLIFSVMIHEISHGYVAEWLGDPTARLAGRLTLDPRKHFSLFGMVIFPVLSYLAWGIPVGGANPVPYNPVNLKNPRRGGGLIALAGPVSNLFIALVFGTILRIVSALPYSGVAFLAQLFSLVVYLNILLAVFNLVPIPPLDGSKVAALILPGRAAFAWDAFWRDATRLIMRNWLLFLILFIFAFQYVLVALFSIIQPAINFIFLLFTGQPFGF